MNTRNFILRSKKFDLTQKICSQKLRFSFRKEIDRSPSKETKFADVSKKEKGLKTRGRQTMAAELSLKEKMLKLYSMGFSNEERIRIVRPKILEP